MDVGIITSCISVVGALLVCLINNYYSNKKAISEALQREKSEAKAEQQKIIEEQKKRDEGFVKAIDNQHMELVMLSNKVDKLSDHVEKHNSIVERTYKLETLSVQYSEIMNRLEQRIEDWHNDTLRRLSQLENDGR